MNARRAGLRLVGVLAASLSIGAAAAQDVATATGFTDRPEVQAWIDAVVTERALDRDAVANLLAGTTSSERVLELISRPAEKRLAWPEYRAIFMTEQRIAAGRDFLTEHAEAFARAEQRYGVPREFVAAIIGVETFYGRITGGFPVLQALATLGFDYPPRSDFFLSELGEFLGLARNEGWDPAAVMGSYAGAMGLPQFISSSYRRYAVDGDGDGRRDLFDSPDDVIASVANYLAEHGWQRDRSVAQRWSGAGSAAAELVRDSLKPAITPAAVRDLGFDTRALAEAERAGEAVSVMRFAGETGEEWVVGYKNFYAITRYNHSRLYARAVVQLAFALD